MRRPSLIFAVAFFTAHAFAQPASEQGDAPTLGEISRGEPSETDAAEPKNFWQQDHLTGDWFGARTKLEEAGLTIDISLTAEWSQNWRGGLNTNGSAFQ